MKYIKIKFTSAKLPIDTRKYKQGTSKNNIDDKVYNEKGYVDRENFIDEDDLIKLHCVESMLNVMLGKRPVPKYRSVLYSNDDTAYNIAKTGYYKLYNTPFIKQTKESKKGTTYCTYVGEVIQGKKTQCDSNITASIRFDNALLKRSTIASGNKKKYDEIVNVFYEITGDKDILDKMSILEVINLIKSDDEMNKKFVAHLKKADKYPIEGDLETTKPYLDNVFNEMYFKGTDIVSDKCFIQVSLDRPNKRLRKSQRINHTYLLLMACLNGEFIFQVSDEEYNTIKNWGHVAKFLDGGLAEFIGEVDYSDIDFDEYVKL